MRQIPLTLAASFGNLSSISINGRAVTSDWEELIGLAVTKVHQLDGNEPSRHGLCQFLWPVLTPPSTTHSRIAAAGPKNSYNWDFANSRLTV
jgi:hypothetical protein